MLWINSSVKAFPTLMLISAPSETSQGCCLIWKSRILFNCMNLQFFFKTLLMTEYLIHSNAKQDKKLQGLYSGIDFCFSISNWKFNDNSINFVKFWIQGIAGQIPLPHKNLKIGCCRIHIRWYCCSILTKMSDGYKILSEIELQKNERTDWIPSTATSSKQNLLRSVSQTLSLRETSHFCTLSCTHTSRPS